jgi:hypothetical protein
MTKRTAGGLNRRQKGKGAGADARHRMDKFIILQNLRLVNFFKADLLQFIKFSGSYLAVIKGMKGIAGGGHRRQKG